MEGHRLAGVSGICLLSALLALTPSTLYAAPEEAPASTQIVAPLFRVFLRDGSSLVSYGELARVDERVIFSMPTSASLDNPELHLVDLASDRVDWERTTGYAESARATHYVQTRAEADYALLTGDIAHALNDIDLTSDPLERLAIVQRARKVLADWPPAHYNYKRDEVWRMLGLLDEAIAELRAAAGAERFDVSLVTTAGAAAPELEPMLPPPTVQQVIEQTLHVATLTDVPAERTSLLSVALAAIERHVGELPAAWVKATRTSTFTLLSRELATDRAYRSLSNEMLNLATVRARAADVRGVERLIGLVGRRDAALGSARPDVVQATLAAVQDQLDAARRLRLERDRWALRLPELRSYRSAIGSALTQLLTIGPALEDIKALSGSGPAAIGAILRSVAAIQKVAASVAPPDEFKDLHGLLLSAVQMAESAARIRRQAALTGDLDRAWNASSAAAGALMLTARATAELKSAFRAPQLPR